jgi:hypothetical protein
VYWEGLSELLDAGGRRVGLGYLEMTGYAGRLRLYAARRRLRTGGAVVADRRAVGLRGGRRIDRRRTHAVAAGVARRAERGFGIVDHRLQRQVRRAHHGTTPTLTVARRRWSRQAISSCSMRSRMRSATSSAPSGSACARNTASWALPKRASASAPRKVACVLAGHLAQHQVAGGRVVAFADQAAESVDVDQQQCGADAVAARARELAFGQADEMGAVGDAGEHVARADAGQLAPAALDVARELDLQERQRRHHQHRAEGSRQWRHDLRRHRQNFSEQVAQRTRQAGHRQHPEHRAPGLAKRAQRARSAACVGAAFFVGRDGWRGHGKCQHQNPYSTTTGTDLDSPRATLCVIQVRLDT